MKLDNKVAIVTGATSGIGLAVSKLFAKEGAIVIVCGITLEDSIRAINEIKKENIIASVYPYKVDVTKTTDIDKMTNDVYEKFGHIDILVNNAGICTQQSILEMTDDDYLNVLDVNTVGTFRLCRSVINYMQNTGGSIINTSSMVGTYGSNYQTAYASSKFAINGLTKSLAKEVGNLNIRVNAIAPGVVETDMVKDQVTDDVKDYLINMTPIRRTAVPADLAPLYLYLASDESSFVTGAIYAIDGGLVM